MKLIITDLDDLCIPVTGEYQMTKPRGNIHPCVGCFGCVESHGHMGVFLSALCR